MGAFGYSTTTDNDGELGEVRYFNRENKPGTDWVPVGTPVSKNKYPELYKVIGDTYGPPVTRTLEYLPYTPVIVAQQDGRTTGISSGNACINASMSVDTYNATQWPLEVCEGNNILFVYKLQNGSTGAQLPVLSKESTRTQWETLPWLNVEGLGLIDAAFILTCIYVAEHKKFVLVVKTQRDVSGYNYVVTTSDFVTAKLIYRSTGSTFSTNQTHSALAWHPSYATGGRILFANDTASAATSNLVIMDIDGGNISRPTITSELVMSMAVTSSGKIVYAATASSNTLSLRVSGVDNTTFTASATTYTSMGHTLSPLFTWHEMVAADGAGNACVIVPDTTAGTAPRYAYYNGTTWSHGTMGVAADYYNGYTTAGGFPRMFHDGTNWVATMAASNTSYVRCHQGMTSTNGTTWSGIANIHGSNNDVVSMPVVGFKMLGVMSDGKWLYMPAYSHTTILQCNNDKTNKKVLHFGRKVDIVMRTNPVYTGSVWIMGQVSGLTTGANTASIVEFFESSDNGDNWAPMQNSPTIISQVGATYYPNWDIGQNGSLWYLNGYLYLLNFYFYGAGTYDEVTMVSTNYTAVMLSRHSPSSFGASTTKTLQVMSHADTSFDPTLRTMITFNMFWSPFDSKLYLSYRRIHSGFVYGATYNADLTGATTVITSGFGNALTYRLLPGTDTSTLYVLYGLDSGGSGLINSSNIRGQSIYTAKLTATPTANQLSTNPEAARIASYQLTTSQLLVNVEYTPLVIGDWYYFHNGGAFNTKNGILQIFVQDPTQTTTVATLPYIYKDPVTGRIHVVIIFNSTTHRYYVSDDNGNSWTLKTSTTVGGSLPSLVSGLPLWVGNATVRNAISPYAYGKGAAVSGNNVVSLVVDGNRRLARYTWNLDESKFMPGLSTAGPNGTTPWANIPYMKARN